MKRAWAKQILTVVAVLGVLTFLFIKARNDGQGAYHQSVDLVRQLKQWDATLIQDVLKARDGLLPHYDMLVSAVEQRRELIRRVKAGPAGIYGTGQKDLDQQVEAYERLLQQQEALVEQFKSQNAVLRNSTRYFPHAMERFMASVGRSKPGAATPLDAGRSFPRDGLHQPAHPPDLPEQRY